MRTTTNLNVPKTNLLRRKRMMMKSNVSTLAFLLMNRSLVLPTFNSLLTTEQGGHGGTWEALFAMEELAL